MYFAVYYDILLLFYILADARAIVARDLDGKHNHVKWMSSVKCSTSVD